MAMLNHEKFVFFSYFLGLKFLFVHGFKLLTIIYLGNFIVVRVDYFS